MFIRGRRLFHFSLPNAAFIGGRRLKGVIRVCSSHVSFQNLNNDHCKIRFKLNFKLAISLKEISKIQCTKRNFNCCTKLKFFEFCSIKKYRSN